MEVLFNRGLAPLGGTVVLITEHLDYIDVNN